MSQMSILRLFCTHLVEFASEVAAIFPHDADIRATKVFLQGLKKINPKALALNAVGFSMLLKWPALEIML